MIMKTHVFALLPLTALLALHLASNANAAQSDPVISIPSAASPDTPIGRAEQLFALAQQGKLDSALADEAASLLDHPDLFVAGIAEWAIATKVNGENNGEKIVWPKEDLPAWYRKWIALDADFLLKADYVRQGAIWGLHHQPNSVLGSLKKITFRATGVAEQVLHSQTPEHTKQQVRQRLAKLQAVHDQIARQVESGKADPGAVRKLWLEARLTVRPIVLANPAADFDRVVFVKRHVALFPNITGSQYPWSHKPGGDICVQEGLDPGGKVHQVIDGQLGPGHVHGIDLWWDADRVVFGYARQTDWPPPWDTISGDNVFLLRGHEEPTHIYELGLDGSGLRGITHHDYWSDFEPTYCANGNIVFASDRSGRSSECGKFSADHTVINLYRVSPASGEIKRLNDNKDIDRYPHSLDNGLIAYTRWEYQERHFLEVHAAWTMRPDGTMADAVFNQHLRAPYGFRDVRSIPGSTKLVAVATGHHTLAYGPVLRLDWCQGINDSGAIENVTPRVVPQEGPMSGNAVPEGGVPDRGGVYQTPFALSESCFLAAYSFSSSRKANGFAIYLIDVFGNKELLHRDRIYSCSSPMPLKRRPRPPQLPDVTDTAQQYATCNLNDVYNGLDGIARGTVKYLRISQHVGWPLDERIGAMRYLPGNAWENKFGHWNWAPVRVLGEVPVEEDGSAHFRVPTDQAVYFQTLDERHMEIRRMRSHVTFQPGEVRGCVGCHETRITTPASKNGTGLISSTEPSSLIDASDTGKLDLSRFSMPEAFGRPPRELVSPPWGADRLLGYEWLVQPILDQHCVSCHGEEKRDGGLDLRGTLAADGFLQSFRTMFGRPTATDSKGPTLVSIVNRLSDSSITKPKQFGSHRSRLIRVLLDDPLHREKVKLDDDQWLALVTWVDANAPYHDRFYNRRPSDGGDPRRDILLTLDKPLEP